MNKKNLITTGLILTLLGSNVIVGQSYKMDKKQLEREIGYKNKIIESNNKRYNDELTIKQKQIDDLNKTIESKNTEIYNLQQQLENAQTRNESPSIEYIITAYTSGYESTQKKKGDKGYGITASGTYVKEGRTIACPPSLEFGTKLNIEGVGLRVCEDRGGAIKEGHLDLYMDSVSEAIEFGKRTLEVEVIQ